MISILSLAPAMILTGFAALATAGVPDAKPALAEALQASHTLLSAAHLAGEIVIADVDGDRADAVMGLANRDLGTAHRVGERWPWASVTKQVTAVLVMQEVQSGKIDLAADLGRYLPAFASHPGLSVQYLLQHRSGLPNPDDTPSGADGVPDFYLQTGAVIGNSARAGAYCLGKGSAAAGGRFVYNNCDYLVLGALLERITGQGYDQLIARRIAQPLGLTTLRVAPDGKALGGSDVTGYTDTQRVAAINIATGGAAAALVGSAADLARFDQALMGGRLLSDQARATLWQGDPHLGYEALGAWSFTAALKGCQGSVQLVERRGDFAGTQVRNVIAPALGRAVIVFTNDDAIDFGEVWQGRGLSYELLSAAFCPVPAAA